MGILKYKLSGPREIQVAMAVVSHLGTTFGSWGADQGPNGSTSEIDYNDLLIWARVL